jgi:hypothetical protein
MRPGSRQIVVSNANLNVNFKALTVLVFHYPHGNRLVLHKWAFE